MKIIADENIPLVEKYFGVGDITRKPGRSLSKKDCENADILLVRAVTEVNQDLLEGTSIKYVGSVTTGMDHLDTAWLDQAGIGWSIAHGCNATAVVEYVIAVIACLQKMNWLNQPSMRAGVIGVGNIGSRVVSVLKTLGFDVIQCDPPRAEKDPSFISTDLKDFENVDFITIHTPLIKEGPYPTYHLIDETFLNRQKKDTVIVNASRGAVIDFNALKCVGESLIWCLDVWENEPLIDFTVLDLATIATPHIAGYSVQAKFRGIEMVHRAAVLQNMIPDIAVRNVPQEKKTLSFKGKKVDWRDVVLAIYDPMVTTNEMKTKLIENEMSQFDLLRKNFRDRFEFKFIDVKELEITDKDHVMLTHFFQRQPR